MAEAFADLHPPLPPCMARNPNATIRAPVEMWETGSDVCMAECLGRVMADKFAWAWDQGRWWSADDAGAWSVDVGNARVQAAIISWLKVYVTQFLADEPSTRKETRLSQGRVGSVEKLLRPMLIRDSADMRVGGRA